MALYAIGDVQGCHAELCELLALVAFSPGEDRLWLTGDLVNRGPASLAVLREVMALGDAATTVLGNHDFHLLTLAADLRRPHRGDTLDDVLVAPDRDALTDWLARRPLVVAEGDWLMVHAGLLPSWTPSAALSLSGEVEAVMAGADRRAFLAVLYGDEPAQWRDDLAGDDRLRAIVNVCTRLRYCTAGGAMEFREKRGPLHAPDGFRPWFAQDNRQSAGVTVICGHWSTLDLMLAPNVAMLDSGCVWGGPLTAIRLPDRHVYQVPSRQAPLPKPSV
ncbi:MAG: symmetrical bis(5'-nucleosyl)-tetraphosphatase [Betaproteobacteria bacterium]